MFAALSKLDLCYEFVKKMHLTLLAEGRTSHEMNETNEAVREAREGFMDSMNDDLNTPRAIAHVFALVKRVHHKFSVEVGFHLRVTMKGDI